MLNGATRLFCFWMLPRSIVPGVAPSLKRRENALSPSQLPCPMEVNFGFGIENTSSSASTQESDRLVLFSFSPGISSNFLFNLISTPNIVLNIHSSFDMCILGTGNSTKLGRSETSASKKKPTLMYGVAKSNELTDSSKDGLIYAPPLMPILPRISKFGPSLFGLLSIASTSHPLPREYRYSETSFQELAVDASKTRPAATLPSKIASNFGANVKYSPTLGSGNTFVFP
mmetsp:Transcript_36611/g.88725  ORF Transcript_36611/g.88725 Transcript_36611/m.88725 type:complete len:229 (-) Transcript_36611:302-988(-)